jgi:replicative DNA helicase
VASGEWRVTGDGMAEVASGIVERLGQGRGVPARRLAEVLREVDAESAVGQLTRLQGLPTGFTPLDELINGGLRPGDLAIVGGAAGIGKTIFALQMARNVVAANPKAAAMYVCYEHDELHLLSRMLCMESAEAGLDENALTLGKLALYTAQRDGQRGLIARLASQANYAPVIARVETYADRLFLVKAHGRHAGMDQIRAWAWDLVGAAPHGLLVVDYLQKIPVNASALELETEVTTHLAQGLKDLAMETGLRIVAIAALDQDALRRKRARLADLRGSSALQYEADVGLILHNKFDIVSREHMVYNPAQADAMRRMLVVSIEKNRAGRAKVDFEHQLDAAHFRVVSKGGFVRERLVDERITLE